VLPLEEVIAEVEYPAMVTPLGSEQLEVTVFVVEIQNVGVVVAPGYGTNPFNSACTL
jgi:hypothetical protein